MSPSSPSTKPSSSAANDGEQIRKDLAQVEDWCRYHAPTEHQQNLLKNAQHYIYQTMQFLILNVKPSRERSIALTELRTARMWVNAAIVFEETNA